MLSPEFGATPLCICVTYSSSSWTLGCCDDNLSHSMPSAGLELSGDLCSPKSHEDTDHSFTTTCGETDMIESGSSSPWCPLDAVVISEVKDSHRWSLMKRLKELIVRYSLKTMTLSSNELASLGGLNSNTLLEKQQYHTLCDLTHKEIW